MRRSTARKNKSRTTQNEGAVKLQTNPIECNLKELPPRPPCKYADVWNESTIARVTQQLELHKIQLSCKQRKVAKGIFSKGTNDGVQHTQFGHSCMTKKQRKKLMLSLRPQISEKALGRKKLNKRRNKHWRLNKGRFSRERHDHEKVPHKTKGSAQEARSRLVNSYPQTKWVVYHNYELHSWFVGGDRRHNKRKKTNNDKSPSPEKLLNLGKVPKNIETVRSKKGKARYGRGRMHNVTWFQKISK
jgi:hypothetical protein